MALAFPQFVRIRNARLQLLHNMITLLVTLGVLVQFFVFSKFSHALPGDGAAGLKVVWSNHEIVAGRWRADASKPYCNASPDYNYWGDDSGALRHEDNMCLPMCELLRPGRHCLVMQETVYQWDHAELFVITHIQEQEVLSPLSNASASESGTRSYFVPAVEAVPIELSYSYTVPLLPWYVYDHTVTEMGKFESHASTSNIVTYVVDTNGKHWKTFAVGEKITLTLGELLELAGASLDRTRTELWPSFHDGVQVAKGPTVRLTGCEIELRIDCRDYSVRNTVDGHGGPVCYLSPLLTPTRWVNRPFPVDLYGSGSARLREATGIFLRTKLSAVHKRININAIFLNMAASAIFFQLPRYVLFVVVVWSLGHSSKIYRRCIYRNFSLPIEAGSMAMRLLAHAESYRAIIGGRSDRITRSFMYQSFLQIMSRRGSVLDEDEIDRMVMFCLQATSEAYKQGQSETALWAFIDDHFDSLLSTFADISEFFGVRKKTILPAIPPEVDMDSFEAACSSCDPISFDSFVMLFDKDRRMGTLESFFMPKNLRDCMKSVHEVLRKGDSTDLAMSVSGDSTGSIAVPHETDSPRPIHPESSEESMRRKMDAMETRLCDLEQQLRDDKFCAEPRDSHIAHTREPSFSDLEKRSVDFEKRTLASLQTFHDQLASLSKMLQRELAALKEQLASGLSSMEATLNELEGRLTHVQHDTSYRAERLPGIQPRTVSTQARIEKHLKAVETHTAAVQSEPTRQRIS